MAFQGNQACNTFKTGMPSGVFNLGAGTSQVYKIALYTNLATLNAETTGYTSNGEVVGAGYSAGGNILTISAVPQNANGITYLSFDDSTWSAAITARGALIYKYDGATNPAVCVLDFGADKTSTTTFTVKFPQATPTSAIIRIN